MSESPDFDAIARGMMNRMGLYDDVITKLDIAEQLRLMWNARGAADIAELDHTFSVGISPSMKVIDQILRALDR